MKHLKLRYKLLPLAAYVVASLFLSCVARKSKGANQTGVVVNRLLFWDTAAKAYVYAPTSWADHRTWYRDSLVIAETVSIVGSFDDKRSLDTIYYTFMNLKTREFYRYYNFLDTAMPFRQFIGPDSMGVDGSWGFFNEHGKYYRDENKTLADTTIEGIRYQRTAVYMLYPNAKGVVEKSYGVVYTSCRKKNLLMQYDPEFGQKLGCPIERIDLMPISWGALSGRVELIAEAFTPEEQKVFAAWEKYAKEHPVKRE